MLQYFLFLKKILFSEQASQTSENHSIPAWENTLINIHLPIWKGEMLPPTPLPLVDFTFNRNDRRFFDGRRNGSLLSHGGLGQTSQSAERGCGGKFGALGQPRSAGQSRRRRLTLPLGGQPRRCGLEQGDSCLGLSHLAFGAQSDEVPRRRVA